MGERFSASGARAKGVGSGARARQLRSRASPQNCMVGSRLRGPRVLGGRIWEGAVEGVQGAGEGAGWVEKTHEIPLKIFAPAPRGTGVIPIIQYTHMWRKMIPCSCWAVSQKTGSAGQVPIMHQQKIQRGQGVLMKGVAVLTPHHALTLQTGSAVLPIMHQ